MGYLAIVVGFFSIMLLCMLNINVMIAAFISAFLVALIGGLPLAESLIVIYFERFGQITGMFFGMYLFGAILAKLYTNSGAAFAIADGVSNALFKNSKSKESTYKLGFLSVILASAILCYGGINAAVALIAIYPIALRIFQQADIPKKFIMGAICGGTFTFALSGPGSPQPTNVVAMIIGTNSTAGLVAGILGALVEIIIMVVVLTKLCKTATKKGEKFELGKNDMAIAEIKEKPSIILAAIPFVVLLVLFNILKLDISLSILITTIIAGVVFFKHLGFDQILTSINHGAHSAMVPIGAIASVNGFAAVVQTLPAYHNLIDGLLNINIAPVFLLIVVVSLICMLTGGSTTGTQIALPILSPVLTNMGLTLPFIHRVGVFAATTLDSLPNSGAVIMAVSLADLKMKDGYPAVFVSTVLATMCGTATVAIVMSLLPMLP